MIATIRELVHRRDLLFTLTWREVQIKYKQSVMGFLWAILMPALIVGAGILVRYAFAVLRGSPLAMDDIVTVAVKSVPWAFFVSGLRFATNSLIANADLVTKVYMPREIFPVASVPSQLVDFLVAAVLLAVFLGVTRVGASWALLWIPVLVLILFLLVTGMGLALAAASLFFRDVKYIVEVGLTFAIFFTPVFYDVSLFPRWSTLLLLNPVAPVLEGLSTVVLRHRSPDLGWVAYAAAWAVIGCAVSLAFFKRLEPYFAEKI